jgi:hypothetical protein
VTSSEKYISTCQQDFAKPVQTLLKGLYALQIPYLVFIPLIHGSHSNKPQIPTQAKIICQTSQDGKTVQAVIFAALARTRRATRIFFPPQPSEMPSGTLHSGAGFLLGKVRLATECAAVATTGSFLRWFLANLNFASSESGY